MASSSSTSLAGLLECSICLDRFTDPKVLPCQHSYCYGCLSIICKDRRDVICPQCRETHAIPHTGVSGFRDNLLVKNLMSLSENQCTECGKMSSVSTCEHCQSKLCTGCSLPHDKLHSEIQATVGNLKEYIMSETTRKQLREKEQKLTVIVESLRDGNIRMNRLFDDAIKQLNRRRRHFMGFFRAVSQICKDLRMSSDGSFSDVSYLAELSGRQMTSKTFDSLTCLKNDAVDFTTICRLIVGNDQTQFRFLADISTVNLELGSVHLGDSPVDIRGRYEAESRLESEETKQNSPGNRTNVTVRQSESLNDIRAYDLETVFPSCSAATSTEETQPNLAATTSSPRSITLQVENCCFQTQLPRNVDYKGKKKSWKIIVGQGRNAKVFMRLSDPVACAYHVGRDEIYVADFDSFRIMVYDSDGKNGREFYQLDTPTAVTVSPDGEHVYLLGKTCLCKVSVKGVLVSRTKSSPLGNLVNSCSLCSYYNHVIVLEHQYRCVIVYGSHLHYLRHFGMQHLTKPCAMAIAENGDIYVTDNEPPRVHVYTWGGVLSRTVSLDSGSGDVVGITIDGDGYACLCNDHRIDVYDCKWRQQVTLGGVGTGLGQFRGPHGLCLMPDGRLIVADRHNNRVQIL